MINLLGNMPSLTGGYAPAKPVNPTALYGKPSPSTLAGNVLSGMGVKATTPTTNVPATVTTLPKSQVAKTASAPILPSYNSTNNAGFGGGPGMTPEQLLAADPSRADPTANQNQQPPAPSQQNASQNNPPTYSGLIQQAATVASGPSADYQKQQAEANAYNEALKQSRVNEAHGLAFNAMNPIPLEFQQGRARILQDQYAQEQAALGSAFQGASTLQGAANTQQGLQQTGLLGAAAAAAPQQVGYNTQYINPQTGQPVNGGGSAGSLPQAAQDFVTSLAQQIQQGKMTRADAESRLSTYGVPGLQALNTALGSGFNTNASNASAATTAIGQQVQAAIPQANQALDSLQSAFNGLSSLQQGGIPGLNVNVPILGQLAQSASMKFGPGRDAASAFQGALQEARSRIDAALVGSIGVNAAALQASALLPNNMVPSEIPGKIAAAKYYLQNQLAGYTQSGQQQSPSTPQNANSTQPAGWL